MPNRAIGPPSHDDEVFHQLMRTVPPSHEEELSDLIPDSDDDDPPFDHSPFDSTEDPSKK